MIDAIITLAERAAKEPRDFEQPDVSEIEQAMLAIAETDLRAAYKHQGQAGAPRRRRRGEGEGEGRAVPGRRRAALRQGEGGGGLQGAAGEDRPLGHPRHRHPHRRPRAQDRAPDRRRGGRAAAHARLGAVHPRRDAGACRRDARHRRGRADDRQPGGHLQGALHAALQLPALLGRRDRPHGRARPPRDRPRQARLARAPPVLPASDEFPYTLRVVSEITESNGSSSMATVCGARWR